MPVWQVQSCQSHFSRILSPDPTRFWCAKHAIPRPLWELGRTTFFFFFLLPTALETTQKLQVAALQVAYIDLKIGIYLLAFKTSTCDLGANVCMCVRIQKH